MVRGCLEGAEAGVGVCMVYAWYMPAAPRAVRVSSLVGRPRGAARRSRSLSPSHTRRGPARRRQAPALPPAPRQRSRVARAARGRHPPTHRVPGSGSE
eukprot:scaffold131223_cov42-Phaeocystis_antarctica.AAC.2